MTSAPKTHTEDTLAFDIAGGPAAGTVTLHRHGAFSYTARHGAAAEATGGVVDDAFEVTVNGAGGVSTVPVSVAAGPSDLSPAMTLTVSDPDDSTGAVTVSATVTGPESDPVVYLVVHDPSYGTLAAGPSGGLIYTPTTQSRAAAADRGPDTDRFEIAAHGSHGRSDTVPVSAEISPHAASVTSPDAGAVPADLDSWQLVHAAPGALVYAAPMAAAPPGPVRRVRRAWQPSGSPAADQRHPGRSQEHSALEYAGYLGRAGLLAVALGVGAALARTPGVAWAEPADTDSGTSSTSASASTEAEASSAESGVSSTSTATRPATGSTDTSTGTTTTGAGPTVTVSSSGGAQTSTTATSETSTTTTSPSSAGSPSQTSTTVSAPGSTSPPVTVSSSGGAQTSTDTAPAETPTAEAAPTVSAPGPEPTAPAASEAPAVTTPAVTAPDTTTREPPEAPVTDAAPATPEGRRAAPTASSDAPRAPSGAPAATVTAPSAAQPAGAPLRVSTVLSTPDTATTAADTTAPTGAATPTAATNTTTTAAAEMAAPSAAPAPATPSPVVNRVISAVLSPFNAPTAAPAVTTVQTPVLFGVFSWIRRTFFNQTPTLAFDPTTTSQDDDTVTGHITARDTDNDPLHLTASNPAHGTVTIDQDGTFTYTVNDRDYIANGGEDTFTITATDQASYPHIHGLPGLLNLISFGLIGNPGHAATTTMNVTVITNGPPVVTEPSKPSEPDQTGAVTGSFVVVDPEGDSFNVELAEGGAPAYGTLDLVGSAGTYTYTYVPNQAGQIRAGLEPGYTDNFTVNITQPGTAQPIQIYVTSADSSSVSAIVAQPSPTSRAMTAAAAPVALTEAVAPSALTEDGFSQQVTILGQATTEAEAAPAALTEDGFSQPYTIPIPIAPKEFAVDDPIEVPGTTGGGPAFVAVTADGIIPPRAYVTNVFDKVEVIDIDPASGTYNTVIDTIPTGASVLAVSPDGTHLYVISSGTSVSVFDTRTKEIIAIVPVDGPYQVVVTPDGTRAYVTASTSSGVSVIGANPEDTLTYNEVIATIGVGDGPAGVAVSPDGARAYVANRGDGTVSVIGTNPKDTLTYNKLIATIPVGNDPAGVAVSPNPDVTRAYVVNAGDGTVSVIDTFSNTVIDTNPVTLETDPIAVEGMVVAVSPDGSLAYVTSYNNHTLSVIDTETNTVIDELIPVGDSLLGVAVTPDGNHIYVANPGGEQGRVGVISIVPTTPTP